jgi:hypothetical protein
MDQIGKLLISLSSILLVMMVTKLGVLGTGSCAAVVALVDGWIFRLLI